jgi:hypothetical protein
VNVTRTHDHGAEQDIRGRLRTIAKATALTGGPGFLLGVLLHPARDGAGIAAVGQLYGITHGLEAISLLLVAVSLVSIYVLDAERFGRSGVPAFLTAVVGTLLWFGLIAVDGTRNPVTARYAPDIVHTTADLDAGAGIISLPALLVFSVGYVLLALLLTRYEIKWPGLLVGVGAVVYWSGSIPCSSWDRSRRSARSLRSPARSPSRSGSSYWGGAGGRLSRSSTTRPPAPTSRRAGEVPGWRPCPSRLVAQRSPSCKPPSSPSLGSARPRTVA